MTNPEDSTNLPSETNWDRVLAYKDGDPIPYDPEDCPYDPNDEEANREWMTIARVTRPAESSESIEAAQDALEARLLKALDSPTFTITPEELEQDSFLEVLRRKLDKR